MDLAIHSFLLIAGLGALVVAADLFLKGAIRCAQSLGISPFIIGVTIVGFGTSAPELTVGVLSAAHGSTGLALGNVVGSNIANIGIILAIAAIIRPLAIHARLLKVEIPLVVVVSLLMWGLSADGVISRFDGIILLIGFLLVGVILIRGAKSEPAEVLREYEQALEERNSHSRTAIYLIVGLAGLVFGSELIVRSASAIARQLGVSDVMIGLTVVAIGTSLPELAATCVATYKGNTDIAVGNVVGSNLFNVLLILGATAIVRDLPVPSSVLYVDLPVMLAFTLVLIPIGRRGMHVWRSEGICLLIAYGTYIAWLIVQSSTQ